MDFASYLLPSLVPTVLALVVLGQLLKGAQAVPDKLIPLLLLGASLILTTAILLFQGNTNPGDIIVQAILATGAAVYGNQVWKQLKKAGG